MSKKQKINSLAILALAGSLALTGCSAADEPNPPADPTPTEEAPQPEETPEAEDTPEAEETPESEEGAEPSGDTPVWFAGSLDAGEKIAEGSTDSWDIQVFQVDTGEMDKDSMFVDPETNENILPAGSEVVYLNFVYTNTGSTAIPLGMIPDPKVKSVNFPYGSGQPGVVTSSLYEEKGLSSTGYDVTKLEGEIGDPFVVEPGQSIAIATSIEYEAGVDAEAKPKFIPKDENGDLVHDEAEEATIVFTVQ